MLKMSFYDGTLQREAAKIFIMASCKPCVYTYGYESRRPTTHRRSISNQEAVGIVDKEAYLDITEEEGCIHLNGFSSNDMW